MKPFFQMVLDLEEKAFRAWPPLEEEAFDEWRLFYANGYGRRGNSVQALSRGTVPLDDKISRCEAFYASKGLPTRFKITPLSEDFGLPQTLHSRGYQFEGETLVQILPALPPSKEMDGLQVEERVTERWQGLYRDWNNIPHVGGETLSQILRKIQGRPFFALLNQGDKPVACASGVLDDGWVGVYEVTTDPEKRRRGHGREIVRGVLSWAAKENATRAYLQVMTDNAPALALYALMGFREVYRYAYFVHGGPDQ